MGLMSDSHKGSIMDISFLLKFLVSMGIFIVIVYIIMSGVNDEVIDMGLPGATQSAEILGFMGLFDVVIVVVFIIFAGLSIYLAWKLNASPFFKAIAIIILLVFVIVAVPIANLLEGFFNDPAISATADTFPIITGLGENATIVVLIIGAVIIIALYSKSESGISGEV